MQGKGSVFLVPQSSGSLSYDLWDYDYGLLQNDPGLSHGHGFNTSSQGTKIAIFLIPSDFIS